ncbi:hypothetical protein D3C73_655040 [compost metagenome]
MLIPDNHLLVGLLAAVIVGEENASQGPYAIFMRCIRIGWVGDIQHPEFEPFLLPVLLGQLIIIFRRGIRGCRAMPVRVIIDILPKVKVVLRKLVRIRGILNKCVAVVASHIHHPGLRAERRIRLGRSKRGDPLLQRHT